MTGTVVYHAALGAFLTLAGATASVVAPQREIHVTFVHLPPPPVEPPVRLPPLPREQVKLVEIPPAAIEPPPIPERTVARARPVLPNSEPAAASPIERPRPKVAPTVSVGAFDAAASARAAEVARAVQPAGFDTTVARITETRAAAAAAGAFDGGSTVTRPGAARPTVVRDAGFGAGAAAGPGRGGSGAVVSGGFDVSGAGGGDGTAPAGAVKTADFDTPQAKQAGPQPVRQAPTEVPLEILSKPTPAYTDEARAMKIEGEVLLEVEFAAAGYVRVLRVIRGLGHGLDQSAMRAVQSIRFKPALRNGQPVDTRTTLNIVFRLA